MRKKVPIIKDIDKVGRSPTFLDWTMHGYNVSGIYIYHRLDLCDELGDDASIIASQRYMVYTKCE